MKIKQDILKYRMSMPLEWKIYDTVDRLWKAYCFNGYISFSGGKDSTVLFHIARQAGVPLVPVFIDTGLEYPEVREFALKHKGVEVIRPKMSFKQVIEEYGYPVISKSQAFAIRKLRTMNLSEKYRNKLLYGDERGSMGKLSNKWHYLINAPFKISEQCCDIMKKYPAIELEEKENIAPVTAELAIESKNREIDYINHGCNAFNKKRPKSTPMAFWTEQDVLEYIRKYKVEIASVYGEVKQDNEGKYYLTGVQRTGCMFCMFGVHLEEYPNRFQKMAETHPQLYKYCLEKLKIGEVLNYLRVEYRPNLITEKTGQLKIV